LREDGWPTDREGSRSLPGRSGEPSKQGVIF